MLKKLSVLIGFIAFLMLLIFVINNSGSVKNGNELEQPVDSLKVGVHFDIKGMGYRRYYDDELSGFEVDLAKQLAKNIYGDESLVELVPVSLKTAPSFLSKGDIDCIVATQSPTGKKEELRYSSPYYTDYFECFYQNGSIGSLKDLSGKKIGVITDSYAAIKLSDMLKSENIEAEIIGYEGFTDGTDAVSSGKIDAFCTNRIFISATNLKSFTLGEVQYCVAVRDKDKDLLEKINKALEELENNGELNRLREKYK